MRNKLIQVLILTFSSVGFADFTNPEIFKFIDIQTLNELIQKGKEISSNGESCRSQNYVHSIKLFYLSAAQSHDFVRAANNLRGHEPNYIVSKRNHYFTLNKCFVEASFFAVMPDVQSALEHMIRNPHSTLRVSSVLLANWDILKLPEDQNLLHKANLTAAIFATLSLGQISACDFSDNPDLYASASYKLEMFFNALYKTRSNISKLPVDGCLINFQLANLKNYQSLMMKKSQQYWGK